MLSTLKFNNELYNKNHTCCRGRGHILLACSLAGRILYQLLWKVSMKGLVGNAAPRGYFAAWFLKETIKIERASWGVSTLTEKCKTDKSRRIIIMNPAPAFHFRQDVEITPNNTQVIVQKVRGGVIFLNGYMHSLQKMYLDEISDTRRITLYTTSWKTHPKQISLETASSLSESAIHQKGMIYRKKYSSLFFFFFESSLL